MPIYLFKDKDNNNVEHLMSSGDVPSIGEKMVIDGKECTRMASFIIDTAGIDRKTHK